MPRKSKTQSTTATAPGQPYGMAGEQIAAMQQIPLPQTTVTPNVNTTAPDVPTETMPLDAMTDTATPQVNPLEQALMDAQMMPAPTAPAFSTPATAEEIAMMQNQQPNIVDQRTMSPVAKLLQEMAIAYAGDEQLEEMARNSSRMGY